jgi:hypothetical protein
VWGTGTPKDRDEVVGVYVTLLQSDTVQSYGHAKTDTRPVGAGLYKKPKDLIASESEECGHGKGVGVYDTLLQSDTVQSYGRGKQIRDLWDTLLQSDTVQSYDRENTDTRTVGVGLQKKPKDLITSEREECGHGEGVVVYDTLLQSDTVQSYGHTKTGTSPVGVG